MSASEPYVFISVLEDSADLHAANLIRAARRRWPGLRFTGFCGPHMCSAGADALADLTGGAAMLTGALGRLREGMRARRQAVAAWAAHRPELVVVVDSSAFHLPLAAAAKRAGLPVLYYIAPQTWASRPGRNQKLARLVDHLACILPFEAEYFRAVGVPATYVGHPLVEAVQADRAAAATRPPLHKPSDRPTLALLPGSRAGVIGAMLPRQLAVVRALRRAAHVLISCVAERRRAQVEALLARSGVTAEIVVADHPRLLGAADLVLVASGTATLEVALYGRPMVVMYEAGPLLRAGYPWAGRFFLKTPHLSLVNILAGTRVVPEFMPFLPPAADIARVAAQLLDDAAWRSAMSARLAQITAALGDGGASDRVCDLIASCAPALSAAAPP